MKRPGPQQQGRPTGPKLKSERRIYISVKEALGEP